MGPTQRGRVFFYTRFSSSLGRGDTHSTREFSARRSINIVLFDYRQQLGRTLGERDTAVYYTLSNNARETDGNVLSTLYKCVITHGHVWRNNRHQTKRITILGSDPRTRARVYSVLLDPFSQVKPRANE